MECLHVSPTVDSVVVVELAMISQTVDCMVVDLVMLLVEVIVVVGWAIVMVVAR